MLFTIFELERFIKTVRVPSSMYFEDSSNILVARSLLRYPSVEIIKTELFFEKTPITVANFISLSDGSNKNVSDEYKNKKYYNGLIFHRVISDFMI